MAARETHPKSTKTQKNESSAAGTLDIRALQAIVQRCQTSKVFTVRRQAPIYFHPPHLKIFKRDGVVIFEGKRKSRGGPDAEFLTGYRRLLLLMFTASRSHGLEDWR